VSAASIGAHAFEQVKRKTRALPTPTLTPWSFAYRARWAVHQGVKNAPFKVLVISIARSGNCRL
jgi:hypothetical protein